ncbi:CynX/NimT family MFS transporter [Thermomonospora cellulosilytica]|uniref:CP family cyanate transporter-like MFS transporter n=1 Tax=Thermomonospora cellulosilytica TaxID=1411118 RepID=A0A7W3MUB9_9ACTN|nr:MFS transporter [Thermomonospora cellulosilytica]MBA9002075.1 CP family cyanate transporter-like MFS transporter [Thermomonospora cellulosilytica]
MNPPTPRVSRSAAVWTVAGLVLLAFNLRAAISGVAPLLDELQHRLGLSSTAMGVLTTLPVLCLGVFAAAAPALARRLGTEVTLTGALALIAGGIVLRTVPGPESLAALPLFVGTVLAGAGIAVANVLMPYVVKSAFPARVGLFTGLTMMLMSTGAALASGLAVPLEETGGWRVSLAVWAIPALLGVALWIPLTIRSRPAPGTASGTPGGNVRRTARRPWRRRPVGEVEGTVDAAREGDGVNAAPGRDGWAAAERSAEFAARTTGGDGLPGPDTRSVADDEKGPSAAGRDGIAGTAVSPGRDEAARAGGGSVLRNRLAWAVTLFLGMQSLVFYVLLSWLPAIMRDHGYPAATAGLMLSVVMLLGIPAGLVMPVLAARRADQRPLVAVVMTLMIGGVLGLLLAPEAGWVWVLVLGVATGSAFPLAYTLITLRSATPMWAARLSGMAQTAGYLLAAAGPFLFGVLHGAVGSWNVPLLMLLIWLVPETFFAWRAARPGAVGTPEEVRVDDMSAPSADDALVPEGTLATSVR